MLFAFSHHMQNRFRLNSKQSTKERKIGSTAKYIQAEREHMENFTIVSSLIVITNNIIFIA